MTSNDDTSAPSSGSDSSSGRDQPTTPEIIATEELAEQVNDQQGAIEQLKQAMAEHQRRLDELSGQAASPRQPDAGSDDQGDAGNDRTPPSPQPFSPAPFPPPPPPPPPPLSGDGSSPGSGAAPTTGDSDSDEPAVAPTFILMFDAGSPEEHEELLALDEWVQGVLVPTYIKDVSSRQPWCARWWQHPEAVARLHALWLAWQELTDEAAGGHTGPSLWHRDHLDDAMTKLRSHDGPFAACMIDARTPKHRLNRDTPIEPYGR